MMLVQCRDGVVRKQLSIWQFLILFNLLRTHAGCCNNLARYMLEHFDCDSYSLILHKTKLCSAALAPFKGTSGVPKQSQAQHEMLNMLKPRLFL
ncbi:hypothetical protein MKW92_036575 [Papaver armeniacum]|nr:hypothetical protein MKW92_036575 [Papaver armeniacum]